MTRNFSRRIEVAFPVLDPALRQRIEKVLDIALTYTTSSWELQADGSWRSRPAAGPSAQEVLVKLTRSQSVRLESYDEALEEPEKFRRRARRRRPTVS